VRAALLKKSLDIYSWAHSLSYGQNPCVSSLPGYQLLLLLLLFLLISVLHPWTDYVRVHCMSGSCETPWTGYSNL